MHDQNSLITTETIETRLKEVIDPELGIDIVSLGLVYKMAFKDGNIEVLVTLTTPGCPLAPFFDKRIREVLSDLVADQAEKIKLTFTFDPPWVADMMTEEAKLQLGMY